MKQEILLLRRMGYPALNKMKTVLGYLALILESTIMCSIGYPITTWQWWAIVMLTILYAFV